MSIVYAKNIGGTVYYKVGATSPDSVTSSDTEGSLTAAAEEAGDSGSLYICEGTYTNTQLGSSGYLSLAKTSQTIAGLGTVNLVPGGSAAAVVLFSSTSTGSLIRNVTVEVKDLAASNNGIYVAASVDNISIKNCTVICNVGMASTNNFYGINTDGLHTVIDSNDVSGTRVGISSLRATAVTITNNHVHDLNSGSSDSASDGIILSGNGDYTGTVIGWNTIHGYRDDGIDCFWGQNALVTGNEVYSGTNWSADVPDGQGIKCGGTGGHHNKIIGNYVHDIAYNRGILDNGNHDGVIAYNIVYNVTSGGEGISIDSTNGEVYHNVVIMGTVGKAFRAASTTAGTWIVQNNIFSGGTSNASYYDMDANSKTIIGGYNILTRDEAVSNGSAYTNTGSKDKYATNPLFVSPTNFRLQATSPAINAGVNVCTGSGAPFEFCTGAGTGAYKDRDGKALVGAPDIGAYEFQTAAVAPQPTVTTSISRSKGGWLRRLLRGWR